MNERAVLLGKSASLTGIISEPPERPLDAKKPAFILLNAGFIHRVGPNRLHVHLARRLACHGFLSVRFDHSGMGDSLVRTDGIPYLQSYITDTQEVMDWVAKDSGVNHFCLMGLCSGAMTSFNTACCDPRVMGAVLLNARGMGGSLEWSRYVQNRWEMREFVRKLFTRRGVWKTLTGKAPYFRAAKVSWNRWNGLFKRDQNLISESSKIAHKLKMLIERNVHLLWISSEWDSSREHFRLITDGKHKALKSHELLSCVIIAQTNHTFDTLAAQKQVINRIEAWAIRSWP